MCYLIAKDREAHGCYAPYHFVDTEQEFRVLVKGLRFEHA